MSAWTGLDLWKKVIIGLVAGGALGLALRAGMGPEAAEDFVTTWLKPWGDAFIRLIKMLIVPLVFTTLVSGVVAMGDPKRLGSLGGRTLALYLLTTAFAVTIGLSVGTLLQPGAGLDPALFAAASDADRAAVDGRRDLAEGAGGLGERLLQVIPENPIAALATADILPIIFFAIIFGVGILLAREKGGPAGAFFDSAAEVMIKITTFVMELAPYGVFFLMAWVLGSKGLGILASLGMLALALYLACALHILITYSGVVKLLLRLPMIPFLRGVADAQAVAYSTASSSATLPVTITCTTKNLGVERSVAASVLPLGATINMDGTAIYMGLVALFGAQAFGVDLSLGTYLTVAVLAVAISIGAAGIPSAGLLLSGTALVAAGVPDGSAWLVIAFIYPFDRLLDMMRTLTNVTGDAAVATAVAKMEGGLDEAVFRAEDRY